MSNHNDDMDYTPDLYTLMDEEGNEQTFELLDAAEVDGQRYFALVPYFDDPDDLLQDDGDLVILRSEIVDGEEMMASIDDDEEYDRIGSMFLERLEEMFESYDGEDLDMLDGIVDDEDDGE